MILNVSLAGHACQPPKDQEELETVQAALVICANTRTCAHTHRCFTRTKWLSRDRICDPLWRVAADSLTWRKGTGVS